MLAKKETVQGREISERTRGTQDSHEIRDLWSAKAAMETKRVQWAPGGLARVHMVTSISYSTWFVIMEVGSSGEGRDSRV